MRRITAILLILLPCLGYAKIHGVKFEDNSTRYYIANGDIKTIHSYSISKGDTLIGTHQTEGLFLDLEGMPKTTIVKYDNIRPMSLKEKCGLLILINRENIKKESMNNKPNMKLIRSWGADISSLEEVLRSL